MKKILLAGEGGQGVQTIAEILARAAFEENKESLYIPNFGVEQRGGISVAYVIIDKNPIPYPKFETADILAIFSNRSYNRVCGSIDKKTRVILGPNAFACQAEKAIRISQGDFPSREINILILGQIIKIDKLVSKKTLVKVMNQKFSPAYLKNPDLKKLHLKAIND